jgi:invasion protein IalB
MVPSSPNCWLSGALGGAFRVIGAVALLVMSSATVAWSPASAASRTEKTFGSWAVVCVEPENEAKACSMMQSIAQVDKQTNKQRLLLRWVISINKNHEQTQVLAVPAGVSIKEGLRLLLGDAEPIVIGYTVCGPQVCIAETPLDAKGLAAIKASKKASVSYVRGSKQLAQVQLDLNGFGEAFDFLTQQL